MYSLILLLFLIFIIIIFFYPKNIKKIKSKKLVPFGYKLFYSDEKNVSNKKNVIYSKLLYSKKYNIQGKPDFIFKKGKNYLPIEIKSGKIKDKLYPNTGDLYQLLAYFLIIEDLYDYKPKYGKLVYSDYTFKIKNTKVFRKEVLNKIQDMRIMLNTGVGNPSNSFQNCKYCLCRLTVCEHCKYN